jgi:HEAT repeat protein
LGEEERGKILSALAQGVKDKHWFNRGAAAMAIARGGGRPDDLVNLLKEDSEDVRPAVASAMGFTGDQAFGKALAEQILDLGRPSALRAAAAISLGLIRSPKYSRVTLENGFHLGGDPKVRGACLAGLYLLDEPQARIFLGKVAANRGELPPLRALAVGFWAKLGAGAGGGGRFLSAVLNDVRMPVSLRRAAVIGLRFHPKHSVPLRDAAEADPSPMVRGFAWISLARTQATSGIRKTLLEGMRKTFDGSCPLEEKAMLALALGWMGDEESGRRLVALYKDTRQNPLLRASCARGLGLMKHGPAVPLLVKGALKSTIGSEEIVGRASVEALALCGGERALATLKDIVFAGPRRFRRIAAEGLAGDSGGKGILRKALKSGDTEIRVAAAAALGWVRGMGMLSTPVEPDRPAIRGEIFQALGDQVDPAENPLRFALALDLDPWAVQEALMLLPR